MTKKEFFDTIINGEDYPEEIKEKALELKASLVKATDGRKSKEAQKRAEVNEPLKAKVLEILREKGGTMVASAVGEAIGENTQKASALLRMLATDGLVEVVDVKVKGGRKVKGYKPIDEDTEEVAED